MLCGAAPRGEVRVHHLKHLQKQARQADWRSCCILRSCIAAVEDVKSQIRLAGAALSGEMRVAGQPEVLDNHRFGAQDLQHLRRYFLSYQNDNVELVCGFGEGAPAHIRVDAAWCCGPTLVIELLWRF